MGVIMIWLIKNILGFVPISGTQLLKSLGFPVMRAIRVSLVMLLTGLLDHSKDGACLLGEPTRY